MSGEDLLELGPPAHRLVRRIAAAVGVLGVGIGVGFAAATPQVVAGHGTIGAPPDSAFGSAYPHSYLRGHYLK